MDIGHLPLTEDYFQTLYSQGQISDDSAESALQQIREAYQYDSCAICLEPGSSDMVKMFNCRHLLHRICSIELYNSQSPNVCPNCRSDMRPNINPNDMPSETLPEPHDTNYYENAPDPVRRVIEQINEYRASLPTSEEGSDPTYEELNESSIIRNRLALIELYANHTIPPFSQRLSLTQTRINTHNISIANIMNRIRGIEAQHTNILNRLSDTQTRVNQLEERIYRRTAVHFALTLLHKSVATFEKKNPSLFRLLYTLSFVISVLSQLRAIHCIQNKLPELQELNKEIVSHAVWFISTLFSYPINRSILGDMNTINLVMIPSLLLLSIPIMKAPPYEHDMVDL